MPKRNHNTTPKPAQTVIVDVPAEVYQADLAKGLQADETLQPGRHTFRRGGFLQRHGETALMAQPQPTKVRISINIDADILEYFKTRAAQPNAAPYQTQINSALRAVMEQDQQQPQPNLVSYVDALLADQRFIDAVARRVAERSVAYERSE
ncbi:MAG: BrnA antitoxin family protein [Caldilineaceae bacterium]